MRRWAACVWSVFYPGVGLALRGRPVTGGILALVIGSIFISMGLRWFFIGLPEFLLLVLLAGGVSIGCLFIDGRGGPLGGLDRARVLPRAATMRRLYMIGFILMILGSFLLAMIALAAVAQMVNFGRVYDGEVATVVASSVTAGVSVWMAVRFLRFVRFLGGLR